MASHILKYDPDHFQIYGLSHFIRGLTKTFLYLVFFSYDENKQITTPKSHDPDIDFVSRKMYNEDNVSVAVTHFTCYNRELNIFLTCQKLKQF